MIAAIVLLLMLVSVTAIAIPEDNTEAEADNSSMLSVDMNATNKTVREPNFTQAGFAIAGLLAVAYFVGRQRKD